MEMHVFGCSGSVEGPDSPASGYVVRASHSDGAALLLDMGPGVLSSMQRAGTVDPAQCHVAFSHMHADHCLDFPSLLVWRRFHPTASAQQKNILVGPSIAPQHLGAAGGEHPDRPDDFRDSFDVCEFKLGPDGSFDAGAWPHVQIGPMKLFALPAVHGTEAYIMRIHDDQGNSLVYSGDTAPTPNLARLAEGADVFLCEATWGKDATDKPEGMHLSGGQAGQAAAEAGVGKLILTHIPPWGQVEESVAAAREYFDGPIEVAHSGMVVQFSA